jgi:hypothetical protein
MCLALGAGALRLSLSGPAPAPRRARARSLSLSRSLGVSLTPHPTTVRRHAPCTSLVLLRRAQSASRNLCTCAARNANTTRAAAGPRRHRAYLSSEYPALALGVSLQLVTACRLQIAPPACPAPGVRPRPSGLRVTRTGVRSRTRTATHALRPRLTHKSDTSHRHGPWPQSGLPGTQAIRRQVITLRPWPHPCLPGTPRRHTWSRRWRFHQAELDRLCQRLVLPITRVVPE